MNLHAKLRRRPAAGLVCRLLISILAAVLSAGAYSMDWKLTGPEGGPVTSLATETAAGTTIYAGGPGGIWKSVDSGDNWLWLPNSPAQVKKIAIDPGNRAIVYAADNEGVFRSTDAGANWNRVLLPRDPSSQRKLTGLVAGPNIVYASFNNTIDPGGGPLYRSTDGGTVWISSNPSYVDLSGQTQHIIRIDSMEVDPFIPRILYMLRDGRLLRSEDSGESCTRDTFVDIYGSARAYAPIDAESVAYIFGRGYSGPGIVRSNDWFVHWFPATGSGLSGSVVTSLVTHQGIGYAILAGTDVGVSKAYYNTWMWEDVNRGLDNDPANREVKDLALWAPYGAFAALNSGVYRTAMAHGIEWQPVNRGLNNSQVMRMAVSQAAPYPIYAGADGSGIFRSDDGGKRWQRQASPIQGRLEVKGLAVDAASPNIVYASASGRFAKSMDGGATWSPIDLKKYNDLLIADPLQPGTLYAFGTDNPFDNWGPWRSTDAGASWGIFGGNGVLVGTSDFIVPGPRSYPMYLVTHAWQTGIYWLLAPDQAWQPIGKLIKPGTEEEVPCSALAVDPRSLATVWAGTPIGPYKSTDFGVHWSKINPPPPLSFDDRTVRSIVIDPETSDVYIGLANGTSWASDDGGKTWHHPSGGVWRSSDGGATWTDLGLPRNRSVATLAWNPATKSVMASLLGAGVAVQDDFCAECLPARGGWRAILGW
jgi:photosystem II stability/assembly factor-like uncharacterized protein